MVRLMFVVNTIRSLRKNLILKVSFRKVDISERQCSLDCYCSVCQFFEDTTPEPISKTSQTLRKSEPVPSIFHIYCSEAC